MKMSFEEFTKVVVDEIKEWLPKSFEEAEVKVQVITKNNDTKLTGLNIKCAHSNIVPTIYLEQFFDSYENGEEMSTILRRIAEIRVENANEDMIDVNAITDFERAKENIMPRLVGAEFNKEVLSGRPHVLIEDLAVIFTVDLASTDEGYMGAGVTDGLAESWGKDANELFEIAISNLQKKNTGIFLTMNEIMGKELYPQVLEQCDGDAERAQELLDGMLPKDDMMYVLTKQDKQYGAALLLDKNMMERVIERVGADFYILPSSLHEVIIVPAKESVDEDYLRAMVREVNATQVSPSERLSNNIYRFSMEKGIQLV